MPETYIKEWEEFYNSLPENLRESKEDRDYKIWKDKLEKL